MYVYIFFIPAAWTTCFFCPVPAISVAPLPHSTDSAHQDLPVSNRAYT